MIELKQVTETGIDKPEHRLRGLALSRGVGMGKVLFINTGTKALFRQDIHEDSVGIELERFRAALDDAKCHLEELAASRTQASSVSDIFGVHLLILQSSLPEKVLAVIAGQLVNAEWAVRIVCGEYRHRQQAVAEAEFREKSLDIDDVETRLLSSLGALSAYLPVDGGSVIIADELRPSLIVEIAKSGPAAIITEHGGWTSHSSILAREFNVPMVSGVRNIHRLISHNEIAIVNGETGDIILNPTPASIEQFEKRLPQTASPTAVNPASRDDRKMADGTEINIRVNVDLPQAYAAANNGGAVGIGLFRSESILGIAGPMPSEDVQFEAYSNIAAAAGTAGVNIRTFDIGVGRTDRNGLTFERNPSLGLRSIRLSLTDEDAFRTQIRALLRAAYGRKIDILLPMITGVGEIFRTRAIIDDERDRLSQKGIEIGEPKIGAMIETPSSVFTIADISANVDFLCLGTNDLVQYMLAVDRDNDAVADWYQTLHPAVIGAIDEVFSAARKAAIPVTTCGEMAGSPFYVPVLIGLGSRELSMNVNSIAPVRRLLSGITIRDTEELVQRIMHLQTAEQIESKLREHYFSHWQHLFSTELLDASYI